MKGNEQEPATHIVVHRAVLNVKADAVVQYDFDFDLDMDTNADGRVEWDDADD